MVQPNTLSNPIFADAPKPKSRSSAVRRGLRWFFPLLTPVILLVGWHSIAALELYPAFLIPPPAAVFAELLSVLDDGSLWEHTQVTLGEMLPGLLIGTSIGIALGYGIGKSPLLEELLTPIIVAFQATPIVAYAPLLVIWFGSGQTSKIVTCAVIVFFPTMMNTIIGIRNVPSGLRDVLRSLRATPWQMFTKLEIPAALPVILAGLKTSATLAVIGAVVGEFVSAGNGLGYLVTAARYDYNTPLVYVTIFTMTVLALTLYCAVSVVAWFVLAWQRRGN